jgi:uncharacterized membrane protein
MYWLILVVIVLLVLAAIAIKLKQPVGKIEGYPHIFSNLTSGTLRLVWSDEFEGPKVLTSVSLTATSG